VEVILDAHAIDPVYYNDEPGNIPSCHRVPKNGPAGGFRVLRLHSLLVLPLCAILCGVIHEEAEEEGGIKVTPSIISLYLHAITRLMFVVWCMDFPGIRFYGGRIDPGFCWSSQPELNASALRYHKLSDVSKVWFSNNTPVATFFDPYPLQVF